MEDIIERIKGLRYVHVPQASQLFEEAIAEIERLRQAIRRLADQDATLSVCDGSVTVTMDATLTDEEREAVAWTIDLGDGNVYDIQNFQWEAEAIAAALLKNEGVIAKAVPLYRHTQPSLTDAEREAIERAADLIDAKTCGDSATLRGLLERTKDGEKLH